jgi:hypothetical protein
VEASRQLFANSKALQASISPGTHPFSQEQAMLYEEDAQLAVLVHLEIESSYLFAKILLDKIAHAFEFYFGPSCKKSLDSHDSLVKNFTAYAGWDDSLAQDRFFGYADKSLVEQVKRAAVEGEFAPEPGPRLFHPDAPRDSNRSSSARRTSN